MIYYLHKSNTGFRATTTLLSKFIRITVETGLTCATFAILDLALFLAFEQNNYHLAPSIALSKIYANSLLVVSTINLHTTHKYYQANLGIVSCRCSMPELGLLAGEMPRTLAIKFTSVQWVPL